MKTCFFDVDGTLLPKYHSKIPLDTVDALNRLRDNGHKVVLCTGRGIKELDFTDFRFDGYILLNGQLCLDKNMGCYFENPIMGNDLDELIKLFQLKRTPVVLTEKDRVYMNFHNEYVSSVSEEISSPPHPVDSYHGATIYMATVYAQEEMTVGQLITDHWHNWAFDAYPIGGGKARGMKEYCRKYRINIADTIAFGDAENDIEMIRCAGVGVAMGNAYDSVKAVADLITDDSGKDGIRKALKNLKLI